MARQKWSSDAKLGCGLFIGVAVVIVSVLATFLWAFVQIIQWMTSK